MRTVRELSSGSEGKSEISRLRNEEKQEVARIRKEDKEDAERIRLEAIKHEDKVRQESKKLNYEILQKEVELHGNNVNTKFGVIIADFGEKCELRALDSDFFK